MQEPTGPCHTCRRRRVKCDLSVPQCLKCVRTGRECLGYQEKLFTWNYGIASRGKMMGKTYSSEPVPAHRKIDRHLGTLWTPSEISALERLHLPSPTRRFLTDPHLQGLDKPSQYYIYYCKCNRVSSLFWGGANTLFQLVFRCARTLYYMTF
jgi:hypothetical protein